MASIKKMMTFLPSFFIYVKGDSYVEVGAMPTIHDLIALYTGKSTNSLSHDLMVQTTGGLYKFRDQLEKNNMLYLYIEVYEKLQMTSSAFVHTRCLQFQQKEFDHIKETSDRYFNGLNAIVYEVRDKLKAKNQPNQADKTAEHHRKLLHEFQDELKKQINFAKYYCGTKKLYNNMRVFFLPQDAAMSNLELLAEVASRF